MPCRGLILASGMRGKQSNVKGHEEWRTRIQEDREEKTADLGQGSGRQARGPRGPNVAVLFKCTGLRNRGFLKLRSTVVKGKVYGGKSQLSYSVILDLEV